MHELDNITIRGFKSISALEKVELGPINVLVGPNGSGKTNFIETFSFLNAIREGKLRDYVSKKGGANRLLHFGSKRTPELSIHISFRGGVNQYDITLGATASDQLHVSSENAYFWNKGKHDRPFTSSLSSTGTEAGISESNLGKVGEHVRDHLSRWRLYHFHDTSFSSPMKSTVNINDNRHLRPDGANLASFLFLLRERHLESYQLIRRSVQRVAPFFDDFILEPLQLNSEMIRLEWRHKGTDSYFDVSSFSDGTLRFVALATLFLQPSAFRPSVIVVDEPELGLHPHAITTLAALIRQSAIDTQILLSTQSPQLLDHFRPDEVLVADRINGSTHLSRLNPVELNDWLEDYSLGQLWEKNELGGRPSRE